MEAIGRSTLDTSIEFHRYNRRRIPVPVPPPRVPLSYDNSVPSKLLYRQKSIALENHSSTNGDAFPRHGADRKPGSFDLAEERNDDDDDFCENGKAFNLVDKKRVEEKNYYCSALTTTTTTNAPSSTNAFEENGICTGEPLSPAVSLSASVDAPNTYVDGGGYGGHRYSCGGGGDGGGGDNDDDDDDDDDEVDRNRIRSCGVKCDYDRNPPVPRRTSKRVFLMEAAQCSRATALVARKIDLTTFSSDCLARPPTADECVSTALDYRLRYGLSSLEISSKYLSSNRDDQLLSRNNGRVIGGYATSHASDGPLSYQTSTAATFFARASQKLKLNSSPYRRKRRGSASDDGASPPTTATVRSVGGFSNLLYRDPPPIPAALLRKIGQKEVSAIGKVKVLVKVCGADAATLAPHHENMSTVFTMDKKKKQIALYESQPPKTTNSAGREESSERKPCVPAPKMFAFEALFSEDDPQLELCGNALSDVIHAVINGNDGCVFSFGNAKIGKTKLMIGSSESPATLGIVPCAIAWVYRAINEQKQKTGTRFSIRVSAIEITAVSQQIKDLLADYTSDNEQSPGVYLKDDPILGSHLQNRCELRAPLPEKAAFYLDAALSERSTTEDSHFLYTLHIYQYNLANKGNVAGGRSRLHLIDLAGNDRSKGGSSLSISNLGNVLLAILNGQKHLPHRDHKITQVLKECLCSLTCHAAIIAHVSPLAQHYHETLAAVQFASRIHRIRRRKIKFGGVSNGMNSTTAAADEHARFTGSSDLDPSSSEQSADTVIYVGPSDETDGEHPPVRIPSLNSADNRGILSKVLRESDTAALYHQRASRSQPASPLRSSCKSLAASNINAKMNGFGGSGGVPPYSPTKRHHPKQMSGFYSAHSSPVRTITKAPDTTSGKLVQELWIDGPCTRALKSKLAAARNVQLMQCKEATGQQMCGERGGGGGGGEMWIDGPTKKSHHRELAYGFMDSHKKSMIRNWVENQSLQLQSRTKSVEERSRNSYKALTVFKTCENGDDSQTKGGRDEDTEATTTKSMNRGWQVPSATETNRDRVCANVQPSDTGRFEQNVADNDSDEEIEIEIIEVEEPEEPVPMQDSCLQVTEEDIAFCMGELENPLPEVDQEEHPLRVLSQENMTVVSSFTDSMSVVNDLECLFPRARWCPQNGGCRLQQNNVNLDSTKFIHQYANDRDKTRSQLFKLHEMYEKRFNLNLRAATSKVSTNVDVDDDDDDDMVRAVPRCQSMMFTELLCNPGENYSRSNGDFENNSIASEPAYMANDIRDDRLCANCQVSLTSIPRAAFERKDLWSSSFRNGLSANKFQSYRHLKSIMNLRHPDGASNPNLQEVEADK